MENSHNEKVVCPEEANLLSLFHSMWKQRAISIIVGLNIPEILCNSETPSMNIDEIAKRCGCHTSTRLYAIMQMLARYGITVELQDKHFTANKSLELLRKDKGPSVGHLVGYFNSDEFLGAMTVLGATVKNGKPAFTMAHGMTHYEYMYKLEKHSDPTKMAEGTSQYKIGSDERRNELADNFSSAMAYFTQLATLPNVNGVRRLCDAFPWSTCKKIVDIGGCTGAFLASILNLPGCEHIQGYVVELPDVVDEALRKIKELGIPAERIEFIKHDFNQSFSVPLQADTLVFKNVLGMFIYDHNVATRILTNCSKLFPPEGGRLLIIDSFAPEASEENVGINGLELGTLSIHRLCTVGGHVMSKSEWVDQINILCKDLDYQLANIYNTFDGGSTILELLYKPIANH